MHVIFGANGRAGGETANALIRHGEEVRVVLRRPEQARAWRARGADVAIADINDTGAVVAALQGASGAFLLSPPPIAGDPYAQAVETGAAFAQAVQRAGLSKAVILSSIGAQHASGTGVIATLNQIETLLDGAAPAIAFLRSGYFVETWSEVANSVVEEGVLPSFIETDRKFPMVSTMDVGSAAADLLCEDRQGQRVVQLIGPEDWSPGDVAAIFAELLDRPVTPAFIAPEHRAAVLAEAGIPAPVADALLGMYEGISSGRVALEDGVELRRGRVSLRVAIERILANMPAAS
ncbi:NmrA family protein [Paracoccus alkanivorans]|uniref:NmrA family protein n=2 Tax=Paracoccus alkanivorans TaxID=2116655 RepID=A0A3M0MG96_9RHOB|nr:NmrA family protein [Paracoccus alkanivorans]